MLAPTLHTHSLMSKGELLPYLGGRWKERVRNLALKIHSTSRKLEFSAVAKPRKIKSRGWHSALSARSGFTKLPEYF